jgi:hypothetical protein
MRNLVVLRDCLYEFKHDLTPNLSFSEDSRVVSVCPHVDNEEILILSNDGILVSHTLSSTDSCLTSDPLDINSVGQVGDRLWFAVNVIYESGLIVCVSHSGNIMSLQSDKHITGGGSTTLESEGCVEDGIADASWSPDQTCIVIVSNNNSILLMTNTFDVINEIPLEIRQPDTPCCISWRGDGMQFALYSVDTADGTARVRFYDRDLVLLAEGKTAAEGPGATVKNLLPSMAYSPNGSLVACVQQRTPKKQQVTQ